MRRLWILWLWALGGIWLTACRTTPSSPSPTLTATPSLPVLTPYVSSTPTATPSPVVHPWLPTPEQPTPTPFVHVIRKGDTLLGIALQYGVSVEALQEANPALDPNLMPIGATVVIPLSEENPAGLPTPTPIPLPLGPVACYPQTDGGGWCLVVVQNPTSTPVEALTGWLRWGEVQTDLQALANLLPAGERTVLLAHLTTLPAEGAPQVYLTTSLPVSAEALAERYLSAQVHWTRPPALPAQAVELRGQITWMSDEPPRQLHLIAIGYTATGQPAAARRWTWAQDQLQGGGLPFSVTLYSLGPPIAQIEMRAEAQK